MATENASRVNGAPAASPAARGGGAQAAPPVVFAVIPVFNRLAFTRECIGQLKRQTYRPLRIVVVDGGSSDGTVEAVRGEHPDVTVLTSDSELWWGGAMAAGIDFALAQSGSEADCVLMMNNDTLIPADYVEQLLRASREHDAAVGPLTVDSRDPARIVYAGAWLDWQSYTFTASTQVAPGEHFRDGVDVLPGRGSLVPVRMIRVAGNVDARMLPHYLGDYEFFYRVRKSGFRLGVCLDTRLSSHLAETGIVPDPGATGFARVWGEMFSRRSSANVIDHWRFAARHAPARARLRIRILLVRRVVHNFAFRTALRVVSRPISWCWHTAVHPVRAIRAAGRRLREGSTRRAGP